MRVLGAIVAAMIGGCVVPVGTTVPTATGSGPSKALFEELLGELRVRPPQMFADDVLHWNALSSLLDRNWTSSNEDIRQLSAPALGIGKDPMAEILAGPLQAKLPGGRRLALLFTGRTPKVDPTVALATPVPEVCYVFFRDVESLGIQGVPTQVEEISCQQAFNARFLARFPLKPGFVEPSAAELSALGALSKSGWVKSKSLVLTPRNPWGGAAGPGVKYDWIEELRFSFSSEWRRFHTVHQVTHGMTDVTADTLLEFENRAEAAEASVQEIGVRRLQDGSVEYLLWVSNGVEPTQEAAKMKGWIIDPDLSRVSEPDDLDALPFGSRHCYGIQDCGAENVLAQGQGFIGSPRQDREYLSTRDGSPKSLRGMRAIRYSCVILRTQPDNPYVLDIEFRRIDPDQPFIAVRYFRE